MESDTLTPEHKDRLARFSLAHQYDPPPFGVWMGQSFRQGLLIFPSLRHWVMWWMFARVWRWMVTHGR